MSSTKRQLFCYELNVPTIRTYNSMLVKLAPGQQCITYFSARKVAWHAGYTIQHAFFIMM